jgi:hypothetical protein
MRTVHAHRSCAPFMRIVHAHDRQAQLNLQQPAPHTVSLAAVVKAKACTQSA